MKQIIKVVMANNTDIERVEFGAGMVALSKVYGGGNIVTLEFLIKESDKYL